MASMHLRSPAFLPLKPFSTCRKITKRAYSTTVFAEREEANDKNYHQGHHLYVDQNLIVLRKRIHEMKMIERNYEPPSDWMDWEKRYYASYDSYICEAVGFLQSHLMNTRPSMAIAMIALITLSVPTSTVAIMFHLLEFTKGALAGIHF